MITLTHYFGSRIRHPEAAQEIQAAAAVMLGKVNALLNAATVAGIPCLINPKTNSQISGTTEGGFRLCDCDVGKARSSHKEGRGVDVYDPSNALDKWVTDEILEKFGLYREHPSATNTWLHLTDRPPKSGRRTFYP
ncbi:MAG TPA: hypothetical protein VK149_12240 [Sideroxyarcus sp.]|nr:hypothetical protein [Sideroxyarcus sp.]